MERENCKLVKRNKQSDGRINGCRANSHCAVFGWGKEEQAYNHQYVKVQVKQNDQQKGKLHCVE